jgi:hypothetical protein
MQVQRDLLVQDVVNLMERHFDAAELDGVVAEIDKLFAQRFETLVNSLELGKPRGAAAAWRRTPPPPPALNTAGSSATC